MNETKSERFTVRIEPSIMVDFDLACVYQSVKAKKKLDRSVVIRDLMLDYNKKHLPK